jgi:hypothetical protein
VSVLDATSMAAPSTRSVLQSVVPSALGFQLQLGFSFLAIKSDIIRIALIASTVHRVNPKGQSVFPPYASHFHLSAHAAMPPGFLRPPRPRPTLTPTLASPSSPATSSSYRLFSLSSRLHKRASLHYLHLFGFGHCCRGGGRSRCFPPAGDARSHTLS